MVCVAKFLEFLKTLDGHKNLASKFCQNYFSNLVSPTQEFNPSTVNEFFRHCLALEPITPRIYELERETIELFNSFYKKEHLDFDFTKVMLPSQAQIIIVKNLPDLEKIISKRTRAKNQKQHFIKLENSRLLVLAQFSDHSLVASIFGNRVALYRGELLPLTPTTQLSYNNLLVLKPRVRQTVEIHFLNFAVFTAEGQNLLGYKISGTNFNKEDFYSGELNKFQEVLYAIKTIERHYINLKTDPFYQELTAFLEQAINTIQSKSHYVSLESYLNLLARSEIALKNIFDGDQLLHLLISDLRQQINQITPKKYGHRNEKENYRQL